MSNKRLRFVLFAILLAAASVLTVAADRSYTARGGVIDPTCTSSLPCIEYDNNGTGPGIRGISISGNGLAGATKNHSTSTANGRAGLIGNDVGTGTFNSGVRGLSVSGIGVSGNSTSGIGVQGFSSSGVGARFDSTNARGLIVTSTNDDGVDAFTSHNSTTSGFGRYGVIGSDASADGGHLNVGVLGASTNGFGVLATSANFVGAQVTGGATISGITYPALSVNGNGTVGNDHLIDACANSGPNPCRLESGQPVPQFLLLANGDEAITGAIFTSGSCHNGCASSPSAGEKRVRLFTPQESLPTVEDFGQAQLVSGRTYVRIDSAFANAIDTHAAYMVVITPEGDSNGLYVLNKTAVGFEVHENRGGRSTLAFSYRIVAKPFGEHPVRLQMITVSRPGTSLPSPRIR